MNVNSIQIMRTRAQRETEKIQKMMEWLTNLKDRDSDCVLGEESGREEHKNILYVKNHLPPM